MEAHGREEVDDECGSGDTSKSRPTESAQQTDRGCALDQREHEPEILRDSEVIEILAEPLGRDGVEGRVGRLDGD